MADAYVAFLRGINVGGKNIVPMKELVTVFEAAKCKNVETYIQSGNVVFEASENVAKSIATVATAAIEKRFKVKSPIVLRTASELDTVFRTNPFAKKKGVDPDSLYVMFLADAPDAKAVASLDPNRSPPDELVVRGREVFLRLLNRASKTKITNAWLDSKLATVSTARNWRTVERLVALSSARSA
jgi:uncharacterized protein (DUF1697 family)